VAKEKYREPVCGWLSVELYNFSNQKFLEEKFVEKVFTLKTLIQLSDNPSRVQSSTLEEYI